MHISNSSLLFSFLFSISPVLIVPVSLGDDTFLNGPQGVTLRLAQIMG